MDDEYAKLFRRMNPPRVVIDNDACKNATIIQVDSVKKHGILLEVVQFLIDLNLIITKAYISSDGRWFMGVFNVTDHDGKKLEDEGIISYIKKSIETEACFLPPLRSSVGVTPSKEHTSIELTGTDRPGLLSEVCAVLADLRCNVVNAEVWTHNARAAAVVHITDESTGRAIEDPSRLSKIKQLLCNVLRGNNDQRAAKMTVSMGVTHTERRLHQMMFDDKDYERGGPARAEDKSSSRPHVALLDCFEKDYTVATMRSKDRPKLLFDTVCTLTDMQYMVFHGTVDTGRTEAYQEYYIRHINGLPISSEAERQRVTQCLEAAIERRASEVFVTEQIKVPIRHIAVVQKLLAMVDDGCLSILSISTGLELELCTDDRVGLLSDITRIFRENGLCITRAEISTKGGKAIDNFYVMDASGSPVDSKTIDSICRQIGQTTLRVKQNPFFSPEPPKETSVGFLFGSFFKARSFQKFRLIRSYS